MLDDQISAILHALPKRISDVVEPWAPPVEEPRNRRVRRRGFEELDAHPTGRHEMRADALDRHVLGRFDLEAERVAIERERSAQILDGDAHMIEDDFHRVPSSARASSPDAAA